MIKKQFALVILIVGISLTAFSQTDFSMYDFSKADNIAINTSLHDDDYFRLAKDLTTPLDKEVDKVRAIFRWIDENIAYDYKAYNKGETDPFFVCHNNDNCSGQANTYNTNLVHRILKRGEAVCNGYSLLFKTLCTNAGIKSDIVTGYIKNRPYQIGVKVSSNHAWNIVLIDSNWYCLDVTWGAGGCSVDEETDKLKDFKKHFNAFYFCTPYEKFLRNHFPEHANELKFMDSKNTKEDFFNFPYFYPSDISHAIESMTPTTGMLTAKPGDTLVFRFRYNKTFQHFQVNSNVQLNPSIYQENENGKRVLDTFMLRRQVYYPYEKEGDFFVVKYPVTTSSLYYLELLIDYKSVVRYKVSVPWQGNK